MWLLYPAGLVGLYFLLETLYPSVFNKALQFICAYFLLSASSERTRSFSKAAYPACIHYLPM